MLTQAEIPTLTAVGVDEGARAVSNTKLALPIQVVFTLVTSKIILKQVR